MENLSYYQNDENNCERPELEEIKFLGIVQQVQFTRAVLNWDHEWINLLLIRNIKTIRIFHSKGLFSSLKFFREDNVQDIDHI